MGVLAALERNPMRDGVQKALCSSNSSVMSASAAIQLLPSGDRNTPVQLVKIVLGSRFRTKGYYFEPVR